MRIRPYPAGRRPRMVVAGMLVAIAVGLWRLAEQLRSLTGVFVVVSGLAIVAGALLIVSRVVMPARRYRLRKLRDQFPQAYLTRASTTSNTYTLVVDRDRILLMTGGGKLRSDWHRDDVRAVVVKGVGPGLVHPPGIELQLGGHQRHETVELRFPILGGLWSSERRAIEAKRVIEGHQASTR
jgi:hypothetical protein